jgi:MFS family permease
MGHAYMRSPLRTQVPSFDTSTLSDRVGGRGLLLTGVGFLIVADIVLATAGSVWQMVGGAALSGLHMGATQGLLSALVVDGAPHDLRHRLQVLESDHWWGFPCRERACWLWTKFGPAATFTAGAVFVPGSWLGWSLPLCFMFADGHMGLLPRSEMARENVVAPRPTSGILTDPFQQQRAQR